MIICKIIMMGLAMIGLLLAILVMIPLMLQIWTEFLNDRKESKKND